MKGQLLMARASLESRVRAAGDVDLDRAVKQLEQLGAAKGSAELVTFVLDGTPIPKARARWSPKHKRFFTPTRTTHAERDLVFAFRVAMARRPMLLDTVAIVTLFYLPTRLAKDGDNLQKLVMDAATKARVWRDDHQVGGSTWRIELDRERPRTVVALAPVLTTLTKAPLLHGDAGA